MRLSASAFYIGSKRKAAGSLSRKESVRQDPDRNFTIQVGVHSTVNLIHPTLAEFGCDCLMGDVRVQHWVDTSGNYVSVQFWS